MEKIILKTEYLNPEGDTTTLILDNNGDLFFLNDDCCKDFEPLQKTKKII